MLNTAAGYHNNFIVQILVVSRDDEEIVDDENDPFEKIFENDNHDLVETETSNWDTLLHEG